MNPETPKFTAVGIHIFAGGFTRGVLQTGRFDVLAQLDAGKFGTATSRRNHPGVPVYHKAQWLDVIRQLDGEAGGVDLVYSNPPCAPWSAAGSSPTKARTFASAHYREDPRTSCVYDVFGLLKTLRPKVWLWESVARAAKLGRPMIEELAAEARALGYATTMVLHDGADCGLPQHRERLFVVMHSIAFEPGAPRERHVTVREAITGVAYDPVTDLEPVRANHVAALEATPPGGKLFQTYNKAEGTGYASGTKVSGRPPFLYRRLKWDRPSWVCTGGPHLFHPEEHRRLSVPEMAALGGYPRDYVFEGSLGDRYRQTAQCVTPPVGRWIADQAATALDHNLPLTAADLAAVRVVSFLP